MKIKKKYLYHVIAWIIFIIYEVSVVVIILGRINNAVDYFVHYLFNIFFFYFNTWLVLKFAFEKKTRIRFILFFLLELIVFTAISYEINVTLLYFKIPVSKPPSPFAMFLLPTLWRELYFLGISSGYAFGLHIIRSHRKIIGMQQQELFYIQKQNILETDLLKARNAYLKLQINPHLLFNTLNFVYNTVRKSSKEGGEAVMLLSDITRYSYLATNAEDLIVVNDELEQITNLVALNQIRFNNTLAIDLDIDDIPDEYQIIPLVLLTLVENMFKYGDLQQTEDRASITAQAVGGQLIFGTYNKKQHGKLAKTSDQTGIKNMIYRLDNYYANNYSLEVINNEDNFEILLKVKLSV
ncbi:sensor histidine kinase [Mucilaginibacter agri]|uniref:Signal transduction histidine kinase internal region domain-containing protein n=1 Tax=Mucilaginibacter agri TaxID=2695265 RepID=A0A965ZI26_9SPHI|nr:sensor histidine kinase [Mucilaginibacter agri]NCD70026.1 hypothetical protein [Mucilaginibacter agri]